MIKGTELKHKERTGQVEPGKGDPGHQLILAQQKLSQGRAVTKTFDSLLLFPTADQVQCAGCWRLQLSLLPKGQGKEAAPPSPSCLRAPLQLWMGITSGRVGHIWAAWLCRGPAKEGGRCARSLLGLAQSKPRANGNADLGAPVPRRREAARPDTRGAGETVCPRGAGLAALGWAPSGARRQLVLSVATVVGLSVFSASSRGWERGQSSQRERPGRSCCCQVFGADCVRGALHRSLVCLGFQSSVTLYPSS